MFFAYDLRGPSMRSFDVDGRLHVLNCRISKANVCPYYGREIPGADVLGLDPNKVYQLYRDPAELERAAPSFKNLQLLMAHIPVNADEPQIELTVGTIGDVHFESPYLVADAIAVWTAEAIALIESKAQAQLSSSYRYTAVMTPGQTPDGVAYDGRMCNIIGNHVALVEEGRAGPDVVVNDSLHAEAFPMKFPKLLAALKTYLKPEADPAAMDAAITTVMTDGKPKSTAFLRIATALKPFMKGATDFSPLAADAEIDKEMKAAEDAYDDEDEDDEKKKAKDAAAAAEAEKAARDASAAVTPGPKEGEVGAALDAALKAGKYITADDAKAMADAAVIDAVGRVNELHVARDAVASLVGVVALDSAEKVYRFALDKIGVKTEGVHASALAQLVAMAKTKAASPAPRIAADSANAVLDIPGLSRVAK